MVFFVAIIFLYVSLCHGEPYYGMYIGMFPSSSKHGIHGNVYIASPFKLFIEVGKKFIAEYSNLSNSNIFFILIYYRTFLMMALILQHTLKLDTHKCHLLGLDVH